MAEMNYILVKKIMAFTLSEVLITIMIIGIVAVMTIPALMNYTSDLELKVAYKKAYAEVSQAWERVIADNPNTYTQRGGWGCTWPTGETTDYNANDGRADALKSYMNVSKSCINKDGCWPVNYEAVYGIPGNAGSGGVPQNYSWVTADGMCWTVPWKNTDDSNLFVDTNCDKGPNLIGKDIFGFLPGSNGIVYFAIDDKGANGDPVSKGNVCPCYSDPATINGRSVSFKSWLTN